MMATRLTTLHTPCETGLTRESVLKANCTGSNTVSHHLEGTPLILNLALACSQNWHGDKYGRIQRMNRRSFALYTDRGRQWRE